MFDAEDFKWPAWSEETAQQIARMVREGNVSRDEHLTESLERELAAYFGVRHALLVNNGTAAAYSAFWSAGLGPGDEVIGPPYSHWATVLPASLLGCKVVFTDVGDQSLAPGPSDIEQAVTSATKAVVVCHLYGNPVDIEAIRKICDSRGLLLIEDVSHAVGAAVSNRRVGSFGDIAFFSMQASKVLAAGEGGCLLTNSYDSYARAVELGHDKRIGELDPQWRRYSHSGRGFKFRLSALHVMLALASFRELANQHAVRNRMCGRLEQALADTPTLRSPVRVTGAERVYWEQEWLLQTSSISTADFRERLRSRGVNAFEPNFPLLLDLPQFRGQLGPGQSFPNIRSALGRMFIVPAFKQANEALVERYAQVMKAAMADDPPSS